MLLFLFSLFFSRSQQQQLPFLLLLPAGTLVCPLSRGLANLIIICFALIIIMIIIAAALVCQIVCKGCCSFKKHKKKNTEKKNHSQPSPGFALFMSRTCLRSSPSRGTWLDLDLENIYMRRYIFVSIYVQHVFICTYIHMCMCQFHLYTCLYGERGGERHAERVQNISEGLANCYCNTGCR